MNNQGFVPNGQNVPQGAVQVGIRPGVGPGPALGQPFPQGAPQPPQGPGVAPQQFQAQISSPTLPKGAQPVALRPSLGMQMQAQPTVAAPLPQRPAFAPQGQPALPYPPQHQTQQHQQLAGDDMDVHTLVVEAMGSDGLKYDAEVDVYFPVRARMLGVREKPRG